MEGGGSGRGRGISPGIVISSLPMSVDVRGQPSSFVRVRLRLCVHFRSRAVAFNRGGWHSFVGSRVRVRVRSWVVGFILERS